ncbi:MAG: tRNA (adenosine(37)-N6)-threonylcarbamoyltransferase complex dimerization subunit type 1 TsaB [Saprospiraceae bacterium]
MNPLILHIETSTEVCSIALSKGDLIIGYAEADALMDHAAQITLLIEDCLALAKCVAQDLDAISVSAGPGSYTALRIGASVAKGMCYALNKPLIAIDTLKMLAAAASTHFCFSESIIIPMIDARRMEVYTAFYDAAGETLKDLHSLIVENNSFDQFLDKNRIVILTGNAAEKCREVLGDSPNLIYFPLICTARLMHVQALHQFNKGQFSDIISFSPEYCKQPNITTAKKIFS